VERYQNMVTMFLWPALRNIETENMSFQQDGVTCRIACATITLFCEIFAGRHLSQSGDQNWPPTSYDLTSLEFFL